MMVAVVVVIKWKLNDNIQNPLDTQPTPSNNSRSMRRNGKTNFNLKSNISSTEKQNTLWILLSTAFVVSEKSWWVEKWVKHGRWKHISTLKRKLLQFHSSSAKVIKQTDNVTIKTLKETSVSSWNGIVYTVFSKEVDKIRLKLIKCVKWKTKANKNPKEGKENSKIWCILIYKETKSTKTCHKQS